MDDTTSAAARLGFDQRRLDRLDHHLRRYVDQGQLPAWQLAITRRGEVAHRSSYGYRDVAAAAPVGDRTLWRIYSMTKPIAAVAAMTLWEQGVFQLTDPISRWIPAFADARVYTGGSASDPETAPAREPIRVWHLLAQTSGITAGWMGTSVVDALYRKAGYGTFPPPGTTLESFSDAMARLPLLFEPGSAWGYGNSTDVLGRLIEIWTGRSLDAAIAECVTGPLGMRDTVWYAQPDHEVATLYRQDDDGRLVPLEEINRYAWEAPTMHSAGGGMLSTLSDYLRFTTMLTGEGELDGVRIVSPRTLRLMTQNHLPGDLAALCTGGFADSVFDGVGFGLGFAVVVDPLRAHSASSAGEYYWGGAASTVFWVDPAAELSVVFMTQLMAYRDGELVPRDALPLRAELRQLVYSSLTA
ncbi:MAG TPA: serine hydrolase domain-containing protein [Solirubrobacteraceae bacterium]|nr:serine hydrolase domain-containing protein [Solirubrobacteraceae bacterium]